MKKLLGLLSLILVWTLACNKPGTVPELPITNSNPAIVRISPEEDRFILNPSSNFQVKLQVSDNEGIYLVNVYETKFTGPWVPGSIPVGTENVKIQPVYYINATSGNITFNGTLPNGTVAPFGTTMRYRFEVVDLDSNKAYSDFFVNVMNITPVDGDSILRYDSCYIYNNLKGMQQYYSFNQNSNSPGSFFDRDIKENTSIAPGFNMEFISPNNTADSAVFARVTDFLNFDALNRNIESYSIVQNAFIVTEPKNNKTWKLSPGEIYILKQRISGQPYQPYIVFKILSVNDEAGYENDYILFTYKRVVPYP
jgi:hypothetical protein